MRKAGLLFRNCFGQNDVKKLKLCMPFPKKVRKFDGPPEFPYNNSRSKKTPK